MFMVCSWYREKVARNGKKQEASPMDLTIGLEQVIHVCDRAGKILAKIIKPTSEFFKTIVNGVELRLRAAVRQEYVYRKAANNLFCQLKPNIPDEQELWYRVLLKLALAIKIT